MQQQQKNHPASKVIKNTGDSSCVCLPTGQSIQKSWLSVSSHCPNRFGLECLFLLLLQNSISATVFYRLSGKESEAGEAWLPMSSKNDVDMTLGDIPQLFMNCLKRENAEKSGNMMICAPGAPAIWIFTTNLPGFPDSFPTPPTTQRLLPAFADHHLSDILHLTAEMPPSPNPPSKGVSI